MARKAGIRFGLFQKTLVTTIGIAVIPLAVIWYLNYEGTAQRIAEHVNGRLDQVSGALATYVDSWVDTNYRMLRQNAELPQSISMKSEQQNPILQLITKSIWLFQSRLMGRILEGATGRSPDSMEIAFTSSRSWTVHPPGSRF